MRPENGWWHRLVADFGISPNPTKRGGFGAEISALAIFAMKTATFATVERG